MDSYGPGIAPAYERPDIEPPPPDLERANNLRLLWDRRRFLFSAMWKTAVVAAVVAMLIPVRYTATTRMIPGENTNMSLLSAVAARATGGMGLDAASGLLGFNTPAALYVQILQSRTVQDRLIDRFDLRKEYSTKYYFNARRELSRHTTIEEDRKSNVISVSVTDHSAPRSEQLANAYVEEMNKLAADLNTSAAHRERVFIENRLSTVKKDLDTAERELSDFSSKTSAIDIKEQARAMVGAAATLQGQLIAAESELKGLEEIYSPNNVRVRAVAARIAELQKQMQKLGGEYTQTGPGVREDASNELYPSIRQLPALGYEYAELYRRTKIEETVFELLTQQVELAKIQEAKELPTVRVMDRAEIPERKSFPPRTVIIVVSALFALLLSSAWVISKERWDRIDPADEKKMFALEVYGTAATGVRGVARKFKRSKPEQDLLNAPLDPPADTQA